MTSGRRDCGRSQEGCAFFCTVEDGHVVRRTMKMCLLCNNLDEVCERVGFARGRLSCEVVLGCVAASLDL